MGIMERGMKQGLKHAERTMRAADARNDSHRNQFYWDALAACVKGKCVMDIGDSAGGFWWVLHLG